MLIGIRWHNIFNKKRAFYERMCARARALSGDKVNHSWRWNVTSCCFRYERESNGDFSRITKVFAFPKIINGAAARNSSAIAQVAATSQEEGTNDFFQLSHTHIVRNFIRICEIASCYSDTFRSQQISPTNNGNWKILFCLCILFI